MLTSVKVNFPKWLKGKWLVISILSLVILIGGIGVAIYEWSKKPVLLIIEGEQRMLKSHAQTVGELLDEEEIDVGRHDRVEPEPETVLEKGMEIEWKAAQEIQVVIDGEEQHIWTLADTVEEMFEEQEIHVTEHDIVQPDENEEIKPNLKITVEKAFPVTIQHDDQEQLLWTTSTTVADLLEQEEIMLGKLDRVEPAEDQRITELGMIRVVRVEKVTDVVEERIPYTTVKRNDNTLERGKSKVVAAGKEGLIEKHFEVTLEDGEEVSRELVETKTVREKQDHIIAEGTKAVVLASRAQPTRTAPSTASNQEGKKTFRVTSTAYTANCSGCSGITSTGINLKKNSHLKVIAVDPAIIPLGTRVHVQGYGEAIAGDTGGNIQGNKIDVFFPNESQAHNWGRRTVSVTILGK